MCETSGSGAKGRPGPGSWSWRQEALGPRAQEGKRTFGVQVNFRWEAAQDALCSRVSLSFWFSPAGETEGHPQEKQREGEASFLGQIYGVLDAACGCQAKMARVG